MTHNIVQETCLSKPIDLNEHYDPIWVRDKTIVITGGASGFGAAFSRHWASHGAHIMLADINEVQGNAVVEDLRKTSPHSQFIRCDVSKWKSQVEMFREAIRLSPHGVIDSVVANAGISHSGSRFEVTENLDSDDPPEPQFNVLDVNLLGVLYTTKLAIHWLQKNPGNDIMSRPPAAPGNGTCRDRHLLLIGSVASIAGMPLHEYTIIIMPYFTDTPMLTVLPRLLLAGSGLGKDEDVVDAATRLMADHRIRGRSLVIGPRAPKDEKSQLNGEYLSNKTSVAIWEAFAHDHEQVDVFTARFVGILNNIEAAKGWIGWVTDIFRVITYSIRAWIKT